MQHYTSPIVTIDDFSEDVSRFKYIRKLLANYKNKKELKLRLILNHLIVLYNVFTPAPACTKMICYKLYDHLPQLKPFLIVLSYWSDEKIEGIEGMDNFYGSDVALDWEVVQALRNEFSEFRIK
jgi:hypothetical protein